MYHFIGIKGAGMSSLAQMLFDLGYDIQGSDKEEHYFTEDALIERGIKILPFDENNIKEDMIVVQGNTFGDENEEVLKAKELELSIHSYQEMVGKLSKMFATIAISGCHGKTTTTAMMSHVFNNIKGCNYLIGDGTGYADKKNEYFALEACEYKRHFLNYSPYYAIITNIELDHIDYYKTIDDVILAYEEYAKLAEKMVIACGDDPYTRTLEVNVPIFFYGLNEENDIVAKEVEYSDIGTSFDVFIEDNYYGHFDLPLYGKHMLLNALAVIGVCYYERLDAKEVAKYLKTFEGAKRRFKEKIVDETVIIDDYAHHPTEIRVTINAAKQKYLGKELIAIFQPHTYSRTENFINEYIEALNLADKAYILPIHPSREKQEDYPSVSAQNIVDKLNNGELLQMDEAKKIVPHKNNVLLFMGANDLKVLEEAFEEEIKNN